MRLFGTEVVVAGPCTCLVLHDYTIDYYLKPTVKLSNCQTVIASRLYIKKEISLIDLWSPLTSCDSQTLPT